MYILIANLINSVIGDIIDLAVYHGGSSKAAGIASVVTFVTVTVVIFGGLVFANILYLLRKKDEMLWIKISLLLIQSLGALLYFYGDNIVQIVAKYGDELGCGMTCLSYNKVAAMIASGSALLFFIEFPTCFHRIVKLLDYKEKNTGWFSASGMIGTYIKIDALYNTVVVAAADVDDFCNNIDISINTTFLLICILTGIGLMVVNSHYAATLLKKSEHKQHSWIAYFVFIILALLFPLFLLTDNRQPLDCAFRCDTFCYEPDNT